MFCKGYSRGWYTGLWVGGLVPLGYVNSPHISPHQTPGIGWYTGIVSRGHTIDRRVASQMIDHHHRASLSKQHFSWPTSRFVNIYYIVYKPNRVSQVLNRDS